MKVFMLALVFVSGCAAHSGKMDQFLALRTRAKSLCEVMADPSLYVGQHITIKGTYFQTPHERLLVDSECSQREVRVVHSYQIKSDPIALRIIKRFSKKDQTVRIPVIYYGIFTANAVIYACEKPSCFKYSLEESQLLAAFPN
jgi:hypothetical protein